MIEEFTKNIRETKNFTFVKVGDGEIDAMICREGVNCDNHAYSKDLSVKLKEAFNELCHKKVFIADWFKSNPPITPRDLFNLQYYRRYIKDNKLNPNFVSPFELLLPGWGNFKNLNLFRFFKEIKLSNRNKIYVGPKVLEDVNQFLNIDKFVEIPKINAFDDRQKILSEIKTVLKDNSIVILTVGLMSPFVSNEILNANSNVTVLDVGSGFDPLFIGQTRSGGQASPEESRAYYAELLQLENISNPQHIKTMNNICNEGKMIINKTELMMINMDFMNPYLHIFPYLKNPNEHYRLLVYISKIFNGEIIIDAGTCQGHSCLSLAQNPNNKIITYDIMRNPHLCDIDNLPNVTRKILDINNETDEIIKSAKLILLDIDPHDGVQETRFYSRLKEINYKGYVIIDDFKLNPPMIDFWNSVTHDKYDLSDLAHWSGTGIINMGMGKIEIYR